jgi:tetratricopeptide (TPR) repeat protein
MGYEWPMSGTLCKRAAVLAALITVPAVPGARAADVFSSPQYRACADKVAKNADAAFEDALTWRGRGGGLAAEHCAALAQLAMGAAKGAATRLMAIARDVRAGKGPVRARIFDQAGNAWLLARDARSADIAFSEALKLAPRDADTWTDRARARAMLRNWAGAEADLTASLAIAKRAETYLLRAAARRNLDRLADARRDVDWAVYLNPRYAEALVERGSLKLIAGDKQGARHDWLQVLLIAPKGPAGDEARRRIEDLEINPDR